MTTTDIKQTLIHTKIKEKAEAQINNEDRAAAKEALKQLFTKKAKTPEKKKTPPKKKTVVRRG